MEEFLAKWGTEIIFALSTAGALGFCKHLMTKNKELEKLKAEDQNRQYRQMILNEIEPIQDELYKIEAELKKFEQDAETYVDKTKQESAKEHKNMYEDLRLIQKHNDDNFNLIINSYKYRLIQLCKCHLRDKYITESDFEQITEMYKLYHGLGGNGQAQEYYEKVMKLEVIPDQE